MSYGGVGAAAAFLSLRLKAEKRQAVGRSREEITWRQLRERNPAEATNLRNQPKILRADRNSE